MPGRKEITEPYKQKAMATQTEPSGEMLTMLDHLTDAITLFDNYVDTLTPEQQKQLTLTGIRRTSFVRSILKLWKINGQYNPERDFERYSEIIDTAQKIIDMATDARSHLSTSLYRIG